MRRLVQLAFASLGTALLVSCASPGQPLPSTVVDGTFQTRAILFRNTAGTPERVTYYLKLFDQDGMLAVCGVWVTLGKGAMDQLIDRWFDEAFVVMQKSSKRIVSTRFFGQIEASTKIKPANCVKSTTPATLDLLTSRAVLRGIEVYYQ